MQDSTLLRASLVISLVGLVALYFLAGNSELQDRTISQAREMEDYDEVQVRGTVTGSYRNGNITILRVTQLEEIKVVVFDDVAVEEGMLIQAAGQVKDYEGEKEISAETIRVIG